MIPADDKTLGRLVFVSFMTQVAMNIKAYEMILTKFCSKFGKMDFYEIPTVIYSDMGGF